MQAAMVDEAVAQLWQAGVLQSTMDSVMAAVDRHIQLRMGGFPVGVRTFTVKWGTLGTTAQWRPLMQAYETEKERGHGKR